MSKWGNEWHHDEIWIDCGLVWRCVSHDSADFVIVSLMIMLLTISIVLFDPWFVGCRFVRPEAPQFFFAWFADGPDLVGFQNWRDSDDSTKSNKRFDLLRIQSSVQDPGREVSRCYFCLILLYLITNNAFYKIHNITYKCEMTYK